MLRKVIVHTRKSIKLMTLTIIALIVIAGIIASFYKISYAVSIKGEFVGYTDSKGKLQAIINKYLEGKDKENDNLAFVQVEELPEYKMCLLKRYEKADDDKILEAVKGKGTEYYRYYAILDNQEEKFYVSTFTEAESIVNQLREKNSANMEKITISEKYDTDLHEMASVETAVASLYSKKVVKSTSYTYKSSGSVDTTTKISSAKVNLGISLIRPVSGTLTSRFGERSRIRSSAHTGLDISASRGTPIVAAADGTVTYSGRKGSYGNMLVITHSNGVQTYYAHCDRLLVSAGQTVAAGQQIATVGSTGNSTGPHLHLEIRVDGLAYNPQNYLY